MSRGPGLTPSSVLDASALLAYLQDETGGAVVEEATAAEAAISVVNLAEALSAIAGVGADPATVARGGLALNDPHQALVEVAPVTVADALSIGVMWSRRAARGLSLGDRACLALASRLGLPALSADRAWENADMGAVITLIR